MNSTKHTQSIRSHGQTKNVLEMSIYIFKRIAKILDDTLEKWPWLKDHPPTNFLAFTPLPFEALLFKTKAVTLQLDCTLGNVSSVMYSNV